MKKLTLALVAALFPLFALAADLVTTITVLEKGKPVFEQTNRFLGITSAQEAMLREGGLKTLDYASKQQDKGGSYTIVWKWADEAAIETPGMKRSAVDKTLRMGVKWLDNAVFTVRK